METMLRIALAKFYVSTESLSRVLHVTSTLHRKSRTVTQGQPSHPQSNNIANIILEMLTNGLRLKVRMQPATMISILDVCHRYATMYLYLYDYLTGHYY